MYSYLNLGLMFVEMGKAESALEHLFNAYRITEVTGELSSSARIWNNIGAAYRLKADWRNANKYANKAESLFRENGEFSGLANVWHNLGLIAYAEGKYETARAYLEESLKTYQILKNQTYANSVKQDIERVTLLLETNNNVTLG